MGHVERGPSFAIDPGQQATARFIGTIRYFIPSAEAMTNHLGTSDRSALGANHDQRHGLSSRHRQRDALDRLPRLAGDRSLKSSLRSLADETRRHRRIRGGHLRDHKRAPARRHDHPEPAVRLGLAHEGVDRGKLTDIVIGLIHQFDAADPGARLVVHDAPTHHQAGRQGELARNGLWFGGKREQCIERPGVGLPGHDVQLDLARWQVFDLELAVGVGRDDSVLYAHLGTRGRLAGRREHDPAGQAMVGWFERDRELPGQDRKARGFRLAIEVGRGRGIGLRFVGRRGVNGRAFVASVGDDQTGHDRAGEPGEGELAVGVGGRGQGDGRPG
jgi:hypothetical protein